MQDRTITAIYGMEPQREDEYPTAYIIGGKAAHLMAQGDCNRFTVSRIERREENFGDHGILWYDVYDGDKVALSMQGRAVAEIHYAPEVTA